MSRTMGLLTRIPLPRLLRAPLYGWFARRYAVDLGDLAAPLDAHRSFATFFQRPLREGARVVDATAPLVWPCDGRIVTAGPITGRRIVQIKDVDYGLEELLGDRELAARLADGSQATVYLAPGDYHRVHAPFDGEVTAIRRIRGTLFPVNPAAVECIPRLFVRNARTVFEMRLDDGRSGAVVMVGALNVGDVRATATVGQHLARGDEIGRFGFGSTTVAVAAAGGPAFGTRAPHSLVRMGAAAAADRRAAPDAPA